MLLGCGIKKDNADADLTTSERLSDDHVETVRKLWIYVAKRAIQMLDFKSIVRLESSTSANASSRCENSSVLMGGGRSSQTLTVRWWQLYDRRLPSVGRFASARRRPRPLALFASIRDHSLARTPTKSVSTSLRTASCRFGRIKHPYPRSGRTSGVRCPCRSSTVFSRHSSPSICAVTP